MRVGQAFPDPHMPVETGSDQVVPLSVDVEEVAEVIRVSPAFGEYLIDPCQDSDGFKGGVLNVV